MFDYRRTHNCGTLNRTHIGSSVTLSGWVHRRRDLGKLIFIDLRDRYGLTQLVLDPQKHPTATKLRNEWVVSIQGKVVPRAEGQANTKLATGEIEIDVHHLEILSPAKTPPFTVSDEHCEAHEELRLKYRYLDIRRGEIARNLMIRHQVMMVVRNYMDMHQFLEITTPILGKSTPEGARDYLVPSRIYPGNFYALPQSPQLFKQLLMVAGMDRYFQIATCFRDEDLRADRQPEFSQVDVEMSFGHPSDLMHLMEGLLRKIFKECLGLDIPNHFPHMTHKECVEKYGTDRPDLRFEMPLVRLDNLANQSQFSIFLEVLKTKGAIKGLCVKGGAEISRKEIDGYTDFVKPFGLGGLAWIKKQEGALTASIAKFFTPELLTQVADKMEMANGDLVFIGAGSDERVNQGMDHLRRKLAKDRGLMSMDDFKFVWVTEFPLLRWNEDEKRLESEHHPFTSPDFRDIDLLKSEPLKVRALAYDIVLNGYEIGGGSQRIHNGELQEQIFRTLNLSSEEIGTKFGFFVEALTYGTPPHLGIALGLDRIIMILAKTDNIRDVIAFPKTQRASDLMMQSPSAVSAQQLKELNVRTEPTEITWI